MTGTPQVPVAVLRWLVRRLVRPVLAPVVPVGIQRFWLEVVLPRPAAPNRR